MTPPTVYGSTPPVPPHAMGQLHRYRIWNGQWVLKRRFWTKKHRGAAAGAFGGGKR